MASWKLLLLAQICSASKISGEGFDFDLFVIGGGSGGLACAKEAASLGARVGLCDYVRPSPTLGTRWGLGGTCVNVGCIPKKLMHHAGQLRKVIEQDAPAYGYVLDMGGEVDETSKLNIEHDWLTLVGAVQQHVKSLNFGYHAALREAEVAYYNSHGSFGGGHEVVLRDRKGVAQTVRARRIVIAVGGRPHYPPDFTDAPEHCISSDDIFSLASPPGKTLVIGGGYVALETAGFLSSLGYDVTVLMRSVPLRGFDTQCAQLVLDHVAEEGTRVLQGCVPVRARRTRGGKVAVRWRGGSSAGKKAAKEEEEEFDTVLVATGRRADTDSLNLDLLGITCTPDGKVPSTCEATACEHVYVIGDAASEAPTERPELTPVAVKAGVLLARRLFGDSDQVLDCSSVPTAVFTPLEYSCVGLSEEQALDTLGADRLEVYHTHYQPLEWAISDRPHNACYCKLLCDRSRNERVVGVHVVGDRAAEIVQGFAVALRLGATKADFDATVGIHPCTAEEMVSLEVTKRSGVSAEKRGC